jgi:hypothetical protein
MNKGKPLSYALIIAVTAATMLAFAAPTASATIVKPANTKIKASLKEGTYLRFSGNNAYYAIYIVCNKSEFSFTTPTEAAKSLFNTNRAKTGAYSLGSGSVSMKIEEFPRFEECTFREGNPEEPEKPGKELGTITWAASAGWSIAATQFISKAGTAALVIPKSGLIANSGCGLVTMLQSVPIGVFTNATHTLRLDGQVGFSGLQECGFSPSTQFEAEYTTNNSLEILP